MSAEAFQVKSSPVTVTVNVCEVPPSQPKDSSDLSTVMLPAEGGAVTPA